MGSVIKKRRKKIRKHKLKKRRKLLRHKTRNR
ncbi:MAG: AURKAIP1/COX24 domain-containing protein [Candidatus Sumerlaeia bacterium]|nr:AURKAIP1/COX24 domain-containing protein [Candidatus Sumerlaeia bacterium]